LLSPGFETADAVFPKLDVAIADASSSASRKKLKYAVSVFSFQR
jgi:hypothetical protein